VKDWTKLASFILTLVGFFLLGVCAGRYRLFERALQFWKPIKKGFWLSLFIGVGAGVGALAVLWLRNLNYLPAALSTDLLAAGLF